MSKGYHRSFEGSSTALAGNASWQPRLGLPAKPQINLHNLKGDDDYAELSSRFKGSSVNILVWWLATETQKMADARGGDPLIIHLALSMSCFFL